MRARLALAIASIVLPTALSAQRIPIPVDLGRRGPAHPEPLPPQPTPVANELAYRRLRLSVESYPMVSYFAAPAYATNGRASSWASVGMGTHADYRITRIVSATVDLTSSFLGGPEVVQTAEVGTRFRPERNDKTKLYPFVDARVGYIAAFSRGLGSVGTTSYTDPYFYGAEYSHGLGMLGGAGFEYALGMRWSILTSAMISTSSMTARSFNDPADRGYTLTSVRYTLGLRYNPVRVIRAGDTR
jgi:hypothetical protein